MGWDGIGGLKAGVNVWWSRGLEVFVLERRQRHKHTLKMRERERERSADCRCGEMRQEDWVTLARVLIADWTALRAEAACDGFG